MKRSFFWLILSCILMLSLVLTSCGTKTTLNTTPSVTATITTTSITKSTTTPTFVPTSTAVTTAQKSKYGGTFTYRTTKDPNYFDPYYGLMGGENTLWAERIATRDFTIDRNLCEFKTRFTPTSYITGMLAESWEQKDPQTIIFHVRQGVHWQDKPPVNGREFTAYDMEYNWHRLLGLGSGYTVPCPNISITNYASIKSITATDKYTLVFYLKQPLAAQLSNLTNDATYNIMGPAREVIDKYGNAQDWRNTVGTGPFILTDYVSSSSLTAIRNPNYWGFDPQNSNNRIPYVDSVKIMIIPDLATAQAALRSGKIDLIENLNWQQATSITRTNPELLQVTRPGDAPCIMMKVDQKPFSDIRVRKAMQMTIDLPTIAKTYYNGTVEEKPMGLVGHKGWYIPFDQWPPEVQAGYTYNPEGAKKLLSDAGYPAGFKCTLSASSTDDLDLYQIMKSYLAAIGIDMQIQVMDSVTFAAYTRASKHEMATNPNTGTTCINPPIQALNYRYSGHTLYNTHHIKDPVFDEMWTKAQSISNEDELKQLIIEAGDYANAQQWVVTSVPTVSFCIYQPWLNRFHGEATTNVYGETFKWFWISKK